MTHVTPQLTTTSKKALLLKALQRKGGANLQALQSVTGWQRHSVRAALSRLRSEGYTLVRVAPKQSGTGPSYRVTAIPKVVA